MQDYILSDSWTTWEQPASPFYLIMTLIPSFNNMRELLGSCFNDAIVIFEPTEDLGIRQARWLFRLEDGRALGQKMLDILMNREYFGKFCRAVDHSETSLLETANRVKNKLSGQSLAEVIDLYTELQDSFFDYYKYVAFTEPIQWKCEHIMTSKIEKDYIYADDTKVNEMVRALFVSKDITFTFDIMTHLFDCSKLFDAIINEGSTFRDLISDPAQFWNELLLTQEKEPIDSFIKMVKEHVALFYWKQNSYFSSIELKPIDIISELCAAYSQNGSSAAQTMQGMFMLNNEATKSLLDLKSNVINSLSPYYQRVVQIAINIGVKLIDRRKKSVMITNGVFKNILEHIADLTHRSIDKLQLLLPNEIEYFCANPNGFEEVFIEREKLLVCYQTDSSLITDDNNLYNDNDFNWRIPKMKRIKFAQGESAKKLLSELNGILNIFESTDVSNHEIKGEPIHTHKRQRYIEGLVRVVKNPSDDDFKYGEILVAPSVTPDYISLIGRCAAFITDWSGKMSHAAVAARTFQKSCIIGTKRATFLLKTGQYVRMDLLSGNIQILDKHTTNIISDSCIRTKNPSMSMPISKTVHLMWVDDELLPSRFIDELEDEGFEIDLINSVSSFQHEYKQLLSISNAYQSRNYLDNCVIIMDVVLKDDSDTLERTSNGDHTGMSLARWIKRLNPSQKIIGCSNWATQENIDYFLQKCDGFIEKDLRTLTPRIIKQVSELMSNIRLPKTFIVHGWDLALRDELKQYLIEEYKFPEPIILSEQANVGRTIIEKIENAVVGVDLVFVLCTPDDTVIRNGKKYFQARPNVLIELGYFYGRLHRLSGKIIVVIKGNIGIPTDIAGVTYMHIKEKLTEIHGEIDTELKALRLIP